MIVVNFKAYRRAQGEKAEEIAEKCRKAGEKTGEKVVVCPSPQDVHRLEDENIDVFSQHLDPYSPGSHTGSITAESVEKAGAGGTLINHSEKRMKPEDIEKAVKKAKKHDLTTIICARNPNECKKLSRFNPDYVAFEPPELIGGDVSVSSAEPELIEEAVEKSEVPTLTGAGIKDREDVEKSIELGCEGVLVASGVVKAENIEEGVEELCRGL